MSDRDSNKNTDGDGADGLSTSCQNRKRGLELETHPDPAPGAAAQVAEGKDSSDDGCDSDGDGGIGEGHRVKPKLELESDPSVNDNVETEEDARKKKSADLKLKVMRNTVVMENISKRLSVRNLLDLRQTCPRWNQSFNPQIRKNHKKMQFKSGVVNGKTRNTDEFMELIRSSQDFPFARYCFGADAPSDKDGCIRDRLNFPELIYEFGYTITSFTATWKGHMDPPVVQLPKLRRIIFHSRMPELTELVLGLKPCAADGNNQLCEAHRELANSVPNLKRFIVSVTHVPIWSGAREVQQETCQLVSDVIQWASGLEFLKIQDGTPNNKIVQAALAGLYLRNFEQSCKTLEVTLLNIGDLKKLIELARQKKNTLQLNSFTTDIKCLWGPANEQKIEAIQLFHDFLITQSKALEKLSITFKPGYLDNDEDEDEQLRTISIPRMETVKNLAIDPNIADPRIDHEGREGLDALLSAFPALRKFSLGSCSAFMDCTELTSHPEVEEFTVSGASEEFIGFTRFGIVFPSLTRLEVKLRDSHWGRLAPADRYNVSELTTIWRAWPSLAVVKIVGNFNGLNLNFDSFLSGVPPHLNLQCMSNDYFTLADSSSTFTLSSLRGILAKYKTMPGISDLKHLREVTIDIRSARKSELERGDNRLTNIGGYFGVALASSHLQRISIHGQKPNELSEDCQAFLRKTFGPCADIDL